LEARFDERSCGFVEGALLLSVSKSNGLAFFVIVFPSFATPSTLANNSIDIEYVIIIRVAVIISRRRKASRNLLFQF
jgi:hypothetical protein